MEIIGIIMAVPLLLVAVGGFLAFYSWQGWWRWLALAPMALIVYSYIHVQYLLSDPTPGGRDHSLWQIELTGIGAFCFFGQIVILLLHYFLAGKESD